MSNSRFSITPALAYKDERLTRTDLAVLGSLACYSDRNGWSYPSQKRVAAELRIARSTVQKSIGNLVACGYLNVCQRAREDGGQTSNKYQVVLDRPYDEKYETPLPDNYRAPPATPERAPPATPERAPYNVPILTYPDNDTPCKSPKGQTPSDAFEQAWAAYGRKGSKQPAYRRWKQVKGDEHFNAIMDAIPKYLESERVVKGYKRDFQTWLRDCCWEQDWEQEVDTQTLRRRNDPYDQPF